MRKQLSSEARAISKARAIALGAAPGVLDVLEELRGRRGQAAAVQRAAALTLLSHVPRAQLEAITRRRQNLSR